MIKNVTTLKLKDVTLNPMPHLCFLYDLKKLGITSEEFAASIEGWYMDIYKWIPTIGMGGATRQTKCPWCEEKYKDLIEHIDLAHHKKPKALDIVKMQNALYSKLMKKIKSNQRNYFSHAILFGSSCGYCIRPRIEGRFGMCALPESARNKMRSLRLLGFLCQDLDEDCLKEEWFCAIIYPEK